MSFDLQIRIGWVVTKCFRNLRQPQIWTGSPGLVVKGGDSYSEGVEFESQRQILDGHFSYEIFKKK